MGTQEKIIQLESTINSLMLKKKQLGRKKENTDLVIENDEKLFEAKQELKILKLELKREEEEQKQKAKEEAKQKREEEEKQREGNEVAYVETNIIQEEKTKMTLIEKIKVLKNGRRLDPTYKELANYIIIPEYYSWDMEKGISELKGKLLKIGKKPQLITVDISKLTTPQTINQLFSGMFLGDVEEALRYREFLMEQAKHVQIVEFSGIHEIEGKNQYISKTKSTIEGYKVLSKDENLQTKEVFEPLTEEEKEWLHKNLYHLRTDIKSMILFWGWLSATFYQIEKEPFPFMQIKATTQSGKTSIVGIGRKIHFGVENNIFTYDRTTAHSIKILGSLSNVTSFFLDEIKETVGKFKGTDTKLSLLRSISDNTAVLTGKIGGTTLSEFRTPIILGGETGKNDTSIINRSVMPEFTLNNKGKPEIFKRLKETDILNKLGYEILKVRLGKNPKEIYENFYSYTAEIPEERARQNATYILIGNHVIQEIIGKIHTPEEIMPYLIESHGKQETNPRKQFLGILETYLESEHHQEKNLRSYDGKETILELRGTVNIKTGKTLGEILIRPQELYSQFIELKAKNLITNELTDYNTFFKDLESVMEITKNLTHRFKGIKEGLSTSKKVWKIKLTEEEYKKLVTV